MPMGTVFSSALIGALAGMAELLPVSGDGHRALANVLFGLEEKELVPSALLHLGILAAIATFLRKKLRSMLVAAMKGLLRPAHFRTGSGHDVLFVFLSGLPAVALCCALHPVARERMESPWVLGIGLCVTTAVLASTYWVRPGEAAQPRLVAALLVGTTQGVSVLPGLSLSGLTLVSLFWLGLRRARSFELGMLLMLPVLLARSLLDLPDLWRSSASFAAGLLGGVVAMLAGLLASVALKHAVKQGHVALFALWTLPLGLATLAMSLAWPG